MGVQTYTMADIISPVAPARLFKAFVLDNHNFLPMVVPQLIKSIELVQGDSCSVGSIKQVNLPEGGPFKYVKNRVDEIDCDKFYLKYTTIEGDLLGDKLECAVYEDSFVPSGTGCQAKMIAHYHTKGDNARKEEDIAAAQETIKMMFKAVEEYLIANPQVYA